MKNNVEPLIQGVKVIGVIDGQDTLSKEEYKMRSIVEREVAWKNKVMHGQFLRDMEEGADKWDTWTWLRKCSRAGATHKLCQIQDR